MATEYEASREYEPLGRVPSGNDLLKVREEFSAAAEPYLQFPWSWLAWGLLLPLAALATPMAAMRGQLEVYLLWAGTVLLGGIVEGVGIHLGRRRYGTSALGSWVMRAQGNLSIVAVLVTGALLLSGGVHLIPGVWLLLLGHSFFSIGSLGFPPFRHYGLAYQLAGALALWPLWVDPLVVFAVATGLANLAIAVLLWRTAP